MHGKTMGRYSSTAKSLFQATSVSRPQSFQNNRVVSAEKIHKIMRIDEDGEIFDLKADGDVIIEVGAKLMRVSLDVLASASVEFAEMLKEQVGHLTVGRSTPFAYGGLSCLSTIDIVRILKLKLKPAVWPVR
jgi:hypothetical protein